MKNTQTQIVKAAILLVISLGLFWFSEHISPANLFEPQSTGWVLWVSYARDLIQPFALYFFLCLGERWLKTWQTRALIVFIIPTLLEVWQEIYYLLPIPFHRYMGAFDLLDIILYAVSAGLAVIVERLVFAKLFKFW